MGFRYNELRGRIVEKYGTQGAFANELGITRQGMSKKMTGKSTFSQGDIVRWCGKLDIDLKDAGRYFFA